MLARLWWILGGSALAVALAVAWGYGQVDLEPAAGPVTGYAAVVEELAQRDADAAELMAARYPELNDPALRRQAGPDATLDEIAERRRALEAAAGALASVEGDLQAFQQDLDRDLPDMLSAHGVDTSEAEEFLQGWQRSSASGNLSVRLIEARREFYAAESELLRHLEQNWDGWRRVEGQGLVFDDEAAQTTFDRLRERTITAQEELQRRLEELHSHQRRLAEMIEG